MWPHAIKPSRIGAPLLLAATRDVAAASANTHSTHALLVQMWRAFGGLIGVVLICGAAAGVLFLVDWLTTRNERLPPRDGDEPE